MDRGMRPAIQNGLLDFLGEKPIPTDLPQGLILNTVASGFDTHLNHLNVGIRQTEQPGYMPGLP